MGGGQSHDIEGGLLDRNAPDFRQRKVQARKNKLNYRIIGENWWSQELPSAEECAEGIVNLTETSFKVDFRTRLKSSDADRKKCQNCYLQRSMDFSFTVFPKPAALFKPSKRTLDNPAFGQNVEIMLFTSLYHLYFGFAERFHCIGKFSACITDIDKDLFSMEDSGFWFREIISNAPALSVTFAVVTRGRAADPPYLRGYEV